MNLIFFNICNYVVDICLMERIYKVWPQRYISIQIGNISEINFSIHREMRSYKIQRKYVIEIDTQYSIFNYKEGEIIAINCEKDKIDLNIYFERLYLTSDAAVIMPRSYKVFGEKEIKRAFNREWLKDLLVFEPLMNLIGKPGLMFLAIGICLSYVFGLSVLLIYIPAIYLVLVGINLLTEKIWKTISKKIFHIDDEKTEFYSYINNDFIFQYYTDRK